MSGGRGSKKSQPNPQTGGLAYTRMVTRNITKGSVAGGRGSLKGERGSCVDAPKRRK